MKFIKGNTDPIGDCGNFAAGLDVEGWGNRVEVYGSTPADAEALRDEFITELSCVAALREELANERNRFMKTVDQLATSLTAAEQRNAKLVDLLTYFRDEREYPDDYINRLEAAIKPTESGAGE